MNPALLGGATVPAAGVVAGTPPPRIPDHEMLRKIGGGSYGEVWLARNIMGNYRAVKLVYRSTFDEDRPFEREFRGIKKFEPISRSHPSQVNILHVGRGEGYFYYVMELADDASVKPAEQDTESRTRTPPTPAETPVRPPEALDPASYVPKTLKYEMKQRRALPYEEALTIITSLATALEHLHTHGLVHRDIKPSNIIFVNGIPKLADIGLVTDAGGEGSFVGTEGYVPPEGPGETPADLYSLGKVLYEMITGLSRKRYPNLPGSWAQGTSGEGLRELNQVVLRACQTDARRRYASASQMRADLALLQSGRSIRRLRMLEHRMRTLTVAGLMALVVGLLSVTGYSVQRRHAKALERLTNESRERASRANVANGARRLEQGDPAGALPWFVEALRLDENTPAEETHRRRIAGVLDRMPRLERCVPHDVPEHFFTYTGFSPSGKRALVWTANGVCRVMDIATGHAVQEWTASEVVNQVAFSSDDHIVVTAPRGGFTATQRSLVNGETRGELSHGSIISHLAISPDGRRLLTGSADGSGTNVRVWDTTTASLQSSVFVEGALVRLAFSQDSRAYLLWNAIRGGFTLRQFEAERSQLIWSNSIPSPPGRTLALSRDGHWVAATSSNAIHVFATRSGRPVEARFEHRRSILHAAFSPDGRRLATAGEDQVVRLWDTRTGAAVCDALTHPAGVTEVVFRADGERLATVCMDGAVRIYDSRTGAELTPPLPHLNAVAHVRFEAEGRRVITMDKEKLTRVWNLSVGSTVLQSLTTDRPPAPTEQPALASFRASSRDGKRLVTVQSTNSLIQVWDAASGVQIGPTINPKVRTGFAAFNGDGQLILTATGPTGDPESRGASAVWEVQTQRQVGRLRWHKAPILFAAFSPDSQRVVTCGRDSVARVWETATGAPVTPPLVHGGEVMEAAFSADGRFVATASLDGKARLWEIASGELVALSAHDHSLTRIRFTNDDKALVVAFGEPLNASGLPGGEALWPLPTCRASVEDLLDLTVVLAGQQMESDGGMMPIGITELKQSWERVKGRWREIWPPPAAALPQNRSVAPAVSEVGK
jgi:WD40 repeat protein/serine/threonine protein kinase